MPKRKNPHYWLERKARRKTGFPLGTISYYGPDESRASKVAVGILAKEKDKEISVMKKWFSDSTDVRNDPTIIDEILEFLEEQGVERVVMLDRMIGCPHEEGSDYPEGETCPQCPYWANRDRWTGELL